MEGKIINLKNSVSFKEILKKNTSNYKGKLAKTIKCAPQIYDLLCNLLSASNLSLEDRNKVSAAIGYLILPKDVFPEEVFGVEGYIDDIYLCLYVLKDIEKNYSFEELLENWDGSEKVLRRLLNEDYEYLDKKFHHLLSDMLYYVGLK